MKKEMLSLGIISVILIMIFIISSCAKQEIEVEPNTDTTDISYIDSSDCKYTKLCTWEGMTSRDSNVVYRCNRLNDKDYKNYMNRIKWDNYIKNSIEDDTWSYNNSNDTFYVYYIAENKIDSFFIYYKYYRADSIVRDSAIYKWKNKK